MILVEPFSGLDPVNMEVMRDTILGMKKAGRTVIFSTHVMAQAEEICDGICLFHKGKLRLNGTMAEVKGSDMNGIHIEFDGDGSFLKDLPGVERANLSENTAEVFLSGGGDSQAVLKACAERLRVRRFDVRPPSLHEIFVRTVGEEALFEGAVEEAAQ